MPATICLVSLNTTLFRLVLVLLILQVTPMTQVRASNAELSTIQKEELKEIVFKQNKKGAQDQ